jgi:hypothetical protein
MLAAYTPGALGLVLAAGSDAIAVAGRHIGLHLLGSIEITEAAIVLLSTSAMLVATLDFHHASVHMLTARLSPVNAGRLARVAALFGALLFMLLAWARRASMANCGAASSRPNCCISRCAGCAPCGC